MADNHSMDRVERETTTGDPGWTPGDDELMPWYQEASDHGKGITKAWHQVVDDVFRTGDLLLKAKKALDTPKAYDWMVLHRTPLEPKMAEKLIKVSTNAWLRAPAHRQWLPSAWPVLFELQRLPDHLLDKAHDLNLIGPAMRPKDVTALSTTLARAEQDDSLLAKGEVRAVDQQVWKEVQLLVEAKSLLRGMQRRIENIQNEPWARYIHMQSLNHAFNLARRLLAYSLPHSLCPYCRGDRCDRCYTLGWVNKLQFDAAPPEYKEGVLTSPADPDDEDLGPKETLVT